MEKYRHMSIGLKMKLLILFVLYLGCARCNVFLNQIMEIPRDNKTNIPVEIVSNYLQKYTSNEQVYLSITSSAANVKQRWITTLVRHSRIQSITYNLLNKLHQFGRKNINIFNLIFVDGSTSLT